MTFKNTLATFMLAGLSLLATTLTAQTGHKTIYVDKMDGLESFVEKALQTDELRFDFIEEEQRPELKATLQRMRSAYGEILYRAKLGRTETHILELRDVATNRVIASHTFRLRGDEESRRGAAKEFADKVRAAMKKNEKSR